MPAPEESYEQFTDRYQLHRYTLYAVLVVISLHTRDTSTHLICSSVLILAGYCISAKIITERAEEFSRVKHVKSSVSKLTY